MYKSSSQIADEVLQKMSVANLPLAARLLAKKKALRLIREGRQQKVAAEEEGGGGLPWWLPLATTGALGVGGYGLSRIPFKASMKKFPGLRKIQDAAKGNMVRSDVLDLHQVDPSKLTWTQKLKRALKYGPEEKLDDVVRQQRGVKDPAAVWQGEGRQVSGTFNPAYGAPGPHQNIDASKELSGQLQDKLTEARMLQKYAPGTGARSLSVGDIEKKYGLNLRDDVGEEGIMKLRKALGEEFGEGGFVIKPRTWRTGGDPGVGSSGKFPSDTTDFKRSFRQWQEMSPEFRKQQRISDEAGDSINKLVEKYRTRPGYEGRVFDEIPHDNVIFQEKLPLLKHEKGVASKMRAQGFGDTQENRVHVIGGRAVPSLAMQRYPAFHPRAIVDYFKARKSARWAQKNLIDKLPPKYRKLHYSLDVAPLKDGGFRVLETNPGVGSGLLDNPVGSHQLHKAITGRHSRPAAAMIGGAAGVAGGAGGLAAQQLSKPEEKRRVPPSSPA